MKIGICWNRKGERTWEIVRDVFFDLRFHNGFSAYYFTVGWWRDATNEDYEYYERLQNKKAPAKQARGQEWSA